MESASLQWSLDDFARFIELSRDALLAQRDGDVLQANAAMARLLGADSPARLIGRPLVELVAPEERARFAAQLREPGLFARAQEVRLLKADGGALALDCSAARFGPAERPITVFTFREPARPAGERAPHESGALHRILVRNLPNVALLVFDRSLSCTLADGEKVLSGAGLDPERLLGRPVQEACPLGPRDDLEAHYRRALSGESLRWEQLCGDRIFDCHLNPLRDEQGGVVGGTVLLYETTAHWTLQRQVAESGARLESLIENTGDAMWSLDREGRITVFNTRYADDVLRAFGVRVQVGMRMVDFLPEEAARRTREHHQRCLEGESISYEWSDRVDGKLQHLLISHNPIISNGEVAGAVLVAKDITARRELELATERQRRTVELLQAIAAAANEATSSDVAITRSLALIAEFGGWSIGHALSMREGAMVSRRNWYLRDPALHTRFREEREKLSFATGSGLPGRVLATGRPAWMSTELDPAGFPLTSLGDEHGLRSGFAFPVLVGDEVTTVVEFFSEQDEQPGEELLSLMSNVGIQLGRVLERERLAAAVRALTLTDELTGLHNRRGFFALASQHLRAVARAKRPTSILFADLDGLKRINDQLGHEAGDEAIARFAKVLRSTFRAADIVSRFGGDEFVILVDGSAAAANTALARLTHQLAEVNQSRSPQAPLAASIGVVEIGADNQDDLETVIARADLAMYENKRTRRATR